MMSTYGNGLETLNFHDTKTCSIILITNSPTFPLNIMLTTFWDVFLAFHARSEVKSVGCYRRHRAWASGPAACPTRTLPHRRRHRHLLVGAQDSSRLRREKETADDRRSEEG